MHVYNWVSNSLACQWMVSKLVEELLLSVHLFDQISLLHLQWFLRWNDHMDRLAYAGKHIDGASPESDLQMQKLPKNDVRETHFRTWKKKMNQRQVIDHRSFSAGLVRNKQVRLETETCNRGWQRGASFWKQCDMFEARPQMLQLPLNSILSNSGLLFCLLKCSCLGVFRLYSLHP